MDTATLPRPLLVTNYQRGYYYAAYPLGLAVEMKWSYDGFHIVDQVT